MSPGPRKGLANRALRLGLAAAAVFASVRLGMNVSLVGGAISPVWPAAGVSLVLVLVGGWEYLPLIFAAGFVAELPDGLPAWTLAAMLLAGVAETALAAVLIQRSRVRFDLSRIQDGMRLAGMAALVAALVGALLGVLPLVLAGRVTWAGFPRAVGVWWVGDAMGILTVAPALLTWVGVPLKRPSRKRLLEAGLIAVAVLGGAFIVFGPTDPTFHFYEGSFLVFPAVGWAALRFGPRGGSTAALVTSAVAIWGTEHGWGPIAGPVVLDDVLALQVFMGVLTLSALLLSAAVAERDAARAGLFFGERLAALGTLAAGVAHEINNPLGFLTTNLRYLARAAEQSGRRSPDFERALADCEAASERIRVIVKDLKVLSAPSDAEGPVRLDRVVQLAVNMSAAEVRPRARLVVEQGGAPPVHGNEARLGQVVLNLIVNAAHSMPRGATEGNEIRIRLGRDGRGRALIEVKDTGGGIAPHVLPRIFDPFFTTKPAGEGTGLGLPICQQIVAAMGGEITIESREGEGTTVGVHLPAAAGDAEVPATPPPVAEAPRAARPKVLVIDDEVRLAESIQRLLAPDFDVTVATSAHAGLDLALEGRFAAVVCDLQMPGGSGTEVHRALVGRAHPLAARLVFVTGGALTEDDDAYLRSAGNRVLEKPVRPEVLYSTLSALCAAPENGA